VKKRILQFIGSFHQGGSESQAVALCDTLRADASYEVFAATLNNEGVLRARMTNAGFTEIPEFRLTSFYNANFVRQVRRCAVFLRNEKIDLVHTHDFYTNIFGMAAAGVAGVPVRIASKRETPAVRSAAQDMVEKLAFGRADAIVVNSAVVRRDLIARGLIAKKIKLIYNGIDPGRYSSDCPDPGAIKQRLGLPSEASRFVTLVANLRHSVKNVPMFLRTAKKVHEKFPEVEFVIAGEGELLEQLKTMAGDLGIASNVHFIGRCDDVAALLSISTLCVLTSLGEGFSNSILEYMAAGKPVVATRVGGAAEAVVDGESGYLVESDDDGAMAERVIELLTDNERAAAFGNRGKKIVTEKFSSSAQLEQILTLYNSLLTR
jgi:L-malate glycosyltransferase